MVGTVPVCRKLVVLELTVIFGDLETIYVWYHSIQHLQFLHCFAQLGVMSSTCYYCTVLYSTIGRKGDYHLPFYPNHHFAWFWSVPYVIVMMLYVFLLI
jgi:hypothetical protein